MPDDPIKPDQGPLNTPEEALIEEMPVEESRRNASLTLRDENARETRAASLEAANRSLSDALRNLFVLLQVVMVALVLLFIFSGFRNVDETESGVEVRFGAIVESNLEPGFHLAFPRPMGDVLTVSRGAQSLRLRDEFMPQRSGQDRSRPFPETGLGNPELRPGRDGYTVTADQNIALSEWTFTYQRTQPELFLANITEEDHEQILRSIIQRAIVRTVAEINSEQLLGGDAVRTSTTGNTSISQRVRRLAQDDLNAIEAGIEITSLNLVDRFYPPRRVLEAYTRANSAVSDAAAEIDRARGARTKSLSEAAGTAYEPLITLIDRYEAHIDAGEEQQAAAVYAIIDRAFEGEFEDQPLTFEGEDLGTIRIAGRVAETINRAKTYRQTVASREQRNAEVFRAKREQFLSNPGYFVVREWSDAIAEMRRKTPTEVFSVPATLAGLELLINTDPEINRRREREQGTELYENAEADWERNFQKSLEEDR